MQVPLYRHNLHGHDLDMLAGEFKAVLSGMMLSTGPICREVAAQFAGYMEVKHCLLTNNWTNATVGCLLSLGIGPGDEVIIPSLTFSATANAIEAVGAKPVLVDVDPHTKLMDIGQALGAVTGHTKAVMPVHLYGQMVDMVELRSILPAHIRIIEDAAHAIESRRDGYGPGQRSDAAMFSFYNSKNMATGEGGAFITNDDLLLEKFTTIYRHGIDLDGYKRHLLPGFHPPEAVTRGIKGNMPDLLALLLKPQIRDIEESHAKRKLHADRYMSALSGYGLEFPSLLTNSKHAWHIFAVGVPAEHRKHIIDELNDRGIKTTVQFKPIHDMRYFKERYGYKSEDHPHSHAWGNKTISLPLFPDLRRDEQDYVIDNFKDIIRSLP